MIQADRAGGMRDHLAWSGFGFKFWYATKTRRGSRASPSRPAETTTLRVKVSPSGIRTEAEAESAMAAPNIRWHLLSSPSQHSGCINSTLGLEGFRVLVSADDAPRAREILPHERRRLPIDSGGRLLTFRSLRCLVQRMLALCPQTLPRLRGAQDQIFSAGDK